MFICRHDSFWLIGNIFATQGISDLTFTTFRMPSLVLGSVWISNQFPSFPEVKKYSASQLSVNSSSKSITWNRSNSELKVFSSIRAKYWKGEKWNFRLHVRFYLKGLYLFWMVWIINFQAMWCLLARYWVLIFHKGFVFKENGKELQ